MPVALFRPSDLRCEYQRNPLGIGDVEPRLSWTLEATDSRTRGLRQAAYRVVAAESADKVLASNDPTPLLWDSGTVQSTQMVHIVYSGARLHSRQRIYWKVRATDPTGLESEWSEPTWFEMGLLERTAEEWRGASFIEPELPKAQPEPKLPNFATSLARGSSSVDSRLKPCSMLRREFAVAEPVARARIFCTAHGIYKLEINGIACDDREFAPEFTPYDKVLCYQTYDVTKLLTRGLNAVGATIADGWYIGRIGMTGDALQYGDCHGLLFLLEMTFEDGSTQAVVSDSSWKCSTGPLVYSDIFVGERFDARLVQEGWSKPGFEDKDWKGVRSAPQFGYGNLVAQRGSPVRPVLRLPCTQIIATPAGETVLDFGQVLAGRIRMKLRGAKSGTVVVMEHSEVLDGNFFNNIFGRNKDQRDVYVSAGAAEEDYEAQFTFHGFRFVKLSGYPGSPKAEDFVAVVLASDLELTGSFECSSPELSRLQQNIVWSQRGNFVSIPTDCPQRERAGWTGDIQVFGPTACFNMDSDAFLTRWLDSLAADQLSDGQVPHIVPYVRSFQALMRGGLGTDSSAAWGDACVIVPLTLYRKYGDRRILERLWPTMEKWLGYITKRASSSASWSFTLNPFKFLSSAARERERFLWNTGFHFGDWLAPSQIVEWLGAGGMVASAFGTRQFVASAQFAETSALMAEVATILDLTERAAYYRDLHAKVKRAFLGEYVDSTGRLSPHLQGTYVLALKWKLVPDPLVPALVKNLVSLIESNGFRLDTGFVSVPHLLDVLCDHGRRDAATKLLYQRKAPSWLFEVDQGATTMWESWTAINEKGRVGSWSMNHYAFGCVGDWIYRNLGGIDVGLSRIVLAPKPDGHLTWAKARYRSVWGEVSCSWSNSDGNMDITLRIPVNTEAHVVLPRAELDQVLESGMSLADAGLGGERTAEGVSLVLGSGEWSFSYPWTVDLM